MLRAFERLAALHAGAMQRQTMPLLRE